jgi:3-hydroxy-9,10-secoandrosta-1,3,5(10)-triene-9,17-dione monooxygenase reductase component
VIVEVDLAAAGAPRLLDPADFCAFKVRALVPGADPDWETLAAGLAGVARVDPAGHQAFVEVDALRRLAGDRAAAPAWRQGFAAMLDYAGSKGWLDEAGAVAGHVEWEPEVAIEADDFRHVLGHFPTGVAVLTAQRPDGPVGMACNSLTSVSLAPPLVAVCPAKSSETWPEIRETGRFLINLMHRDHAETVLGFARKGSDRFAGVPYHQRAAGPALDEALAWIECAIVAEHDAGDHKIVVARALDLQARGDLEPLVFFRGRYGTFAAAGN